MLDYKLYLKASNGNGEAVRANVVAERPIGLNEINVDSVLNWPDKFVATSGIIDPATGTFENGTVTIFFGHLNGTYLIIDEYAPGYSDMGNNANEVIVLKPNTPWADKLINAVENGGVKDHYLLEHIGINTHDQIDTKIASLLNEREITKESTGFTNNSDINVSYDSTTRKITLTGTFEAYYKGEKITELVSGWVSEAHADVAGTYFLRYCVDDGGFAFDTSPWEFDCLQIAFAQYNGQKFALRETHGFMQWQSHKELHDVIGTYRASGGGMVGYTLNSTTAANRRPDMEATVVQDEDLQSTITSLTTKLYTQRYLTGAALRSFTTGASDIIALNGDIPYYNQNVGGVWQQTPMSNNEYGAIFIVAIPTTSDAGSLNYRYLFVQPQQVGTLAQIQDIDVSDLTHGDSSTLVSEFVFIGKIIIGVSGNNWTIQSYELLAGTRLGQLSGGSGGGGITSVEHDTTLTGAGTVDSPLGVSTSIIIGSNSSKPDETPTGSVNGVNLIFTTSVPYIANSLEVFINGIKQKRNVHFTETTPGSGIFTMSDAPLTGDDIMVCYQFVSSVSGNADTLDGFHASATPTANSVPVLDSTARLPVLARTLLGFCSYFGYLSSNQTTTSTTPVAISTISSNITTKGGALLLMLTLPVGVSGQTSSGGLYINEVFYQLIITQTNSNLPQTGFLTIAAGVVPAGTYAVTPRFYSQSSGVTSTIYQYSTISFSVIEI